MFGKGCFHPLKSQIREAKLLSCLPKEGLACFEFLICENPAQMLDLPVLRPALVPSQRVYISARKADTPEPALECGGHVQRPRDISCALLQPHLFNISCGFLWGCVSGKRCFHVKSPKLAIYGIFPGAKEYQPRVCAFFFPSSRCQTQE